MSICNDEKSKNITVYLHKECTLDCSFCFQKHSLFLKNLSHLNFDKIYDKIQEVTEEKKLNINFTGGELFFSEKVIDDLINFIEKLRKEYDVKIVPSSCLICNMNLCYKFMDYLYEHDLIVNFSTSFDFKTRFRNDAIAKLWYNNLKSLRAKYPKLDIIVNTIITNELIDTFLNNASPIEKEIFEEVYLKHTIALQILSVYDKKDIVTNERISEIHKYFMEHFPKIVFLYTGYGKQCSYNNTYIIYGDGTGVKGCCENNYGEKVDLDEIKKLYIKHNQCLFCKRYGYCQHECYMEWWFRNRDDLANSKCHYKVIGEV